MRAYDCDVAQYLAWRAADCDRKISQLRTADLDGASMRAWMASLNRAGQARTTVARKLSGVRAFVHYLRREDVIDGDPTLAAVAPKLDKTDSGPPLRDRDHGAARQPSMSARRSAAATGRCSSCSMPPACA